jgi:hypothetical protein
MDKKKSKESDNNIALSMAIDVLAETFERAATLDDTARRFTTADVAAAIGDLTGFTPSVQVVYQTLIAEGYQYVVDETYTGLRYVWLLKYKK